MTEGRWPVKVQPLPWWGGKPAGGKAEWICSLLPWRKDSTYIETHGGMACVMARRAPVKCEIYNDMEGRAVNWFRVLREQTKKFKHLVALTPHSREEYERAHGMLDDINELQRAWAFHVVVSQGVTPSVKDDGWIIGRTTTLSSTQFPWDGSRVDSLVSRFRKVQFENRDAIGVLEWVSDTENSVIYCDPPYRTSTTSKYRHGDVDVDGLTAAILVQKGQVAISGYGDEWEHLNWQRHELESWIVSNGANKISEPRTEVLWTNYDGTQNRR